MHDRFIPGQFTKASDFSRAEFCSTSFLYVTVPDLLSQKLLAAIDLDLQAFPMQFGITRGIRRHFVLPSISIGIKFVRPTVLSPRNGTVQ
jgi:hypothetical protein